jgi:hypothetical protein
MGEDTQYQSIKDLAKLYREVIGHDPVDGGDFRNFVEAIIGIGHYINLMNQNTPKTTVQPEETR